MKLQDSESMQSHAIPLLRRDGSIAGYTRVDPCDVEWVSKWTWRLSSEGYAVRSDSRESKRRTVYLHRELAGTPPGLVTDHLNGARLDNRRKNLRIATVLQNNLNARQRPNKSGYRGVYWHSPSTKWVAQISNHGKLKHLGLFDDPREASRAYESAALCRCPPQPTRPRV